MTARRSDSSIEIDRPVEEVWAFVTDLGRWPEWRTTITSIDPPASLTVGEGFSGTTHIIGRTWHWQLELTVVEPNLRLAYDVVKGVAKPTVDYHLEPLGDRCRFTMTGTIDRMGVLGRILAPVALPALRRESSAHVQNLKRILEHEDGLDR
jgi:uncharacterized protein YndB with AHSA1/START domain